MIEQHQGLQRLKIGEGYISGYLSILFGLVSLGAVICFLFPQYFTTPEFRVHYPLEIIRVLLLLCIISSYLFSAMSFVLSRRPKLALSGALLSTFAVLLGGGWY